MLFLKITEIKYENAFQLTTPQKAENRRVGSVASMGCLMISTELVFMSRIESTDSRQNLQSKPKQ